MSRARGAAAAGLLMLMLAPAPLVAQPLTERAPNLEGTWTAAPHDLFFQFSHRFQVAGTDADISDVFGDGKVVNYPTFGLSYGLFPGAALGVRYSSNSLIAGTANEWQPFVKYAVPGAGGGNVSAALTGAWNGANDSFDGELAVQLDYQAARMILAARAFSSPFDRPEDEAELALAGGGRLKLNRYLSFSGDYANMFTQSDAQIAWSAGLAFEIPYTPHTLALFATNVSSGTLEGASVGVDGTTFWGFEFTVRLSGHRWGEVFNPREAPGGGGQAAAGGEGEPGAAERDGVVVVEISQLAFAPAELTIPAGTTVRWVNRDPIAHTSTSDDGRWESPPLETGDSFEFTFDEPGTYGYHCLPHPVMKATVTVTGSGDGD